MLIELMPELIGLTQGDDLAECIRAKLRTFPDKYAAKAPPGYEEQYRRVAENQIAEFLELPDAELFRWKLNAEHPEYRWN